MPSSELETLARIGKLKREAPAKSEIQGLVRSGEARLADAANRDLSLESRFDLAYNAAHALALAALAKQGLSFGEPLSLVWNSAPPDPGTAPA